MALGSIVLQSRGQLMQQPSQSDRRSGHEVDGWRTRNHGTAAQRSCGPSRIPCWRLRLGRVFLDCRLLQWPVLEISQLVAADLL